MHGPWLAGTLFLLLDGRYDWLDGMQLDAFTCLGASHKRCHAAAASSHNSLSACTASPSRPARRRRHQQMSKSM